MIVSKWGMSPVSLCASDCPEPLRSGNKDGIKYAKILLMEVLVWWRKALYIGQSKTERSPIWDKILRESRWVDLRSLKVVVFCFVWFFWVKVSFQRVYLLGRDWYTLPCWGPSLALSIIVGLVFSTNVLMYSTVWAFDQIWLSAWPCNNAFFQSSSWASSYFVFVLEWPYPHHDTHCHPLFSV